MGNDIKSFTDELVNVIIFNGDSMKLKKFFGHLNTVNKHRFLVFKYCVKAGIPFRGLVHDLSKYSLLEFLEGVKYYNGNFSPISTCKKVNGYSKAWLHHKGRNKHHFEYWYDFNSPLKTPVIPYKYVVELICDNIAASKTYLKDKWNLNSQLNYFLNRKDLKYINPKIKDMLINVYSDMIDIGIDGVLNKKYLKYMYKKYVEE